MRQNLNSIIFCFLLASLLIAGCSEQESSHKQQIQAAVYSMFEDGWNLGDVEFFDMTLADSVLFHYAGLPRMMTRQEMSQIVLRWRQAFPDLRMDLKELIIEKDVAAGRLILSGTHKAPWAAPVSCSGVLADSCCNGFQSRCFYEYLIRKTL